MAVKLLLILAAILVSIGFFLPIYLEKNWVPEVELKEKWENVGLLVTAEGFRDNFIVDICPSLKNYAILGPYVIAKKEDYRAINGYIKYEKPAQYEFFVGKIASGKPRPLITYEDFKEIKKINEFPYRFYFLVKVEDADFEGVEKRLETTEIIFYNEEGKYLKVNLTPVIYKPSPVLIEPLDRYFETNLNQNNYYQLTISGGCGPFLYPWEGKVEVSISPPIDVIIKGESGSEDIIVLDNRRFVVNIKNGQRVGIDLLVKFKKFGNFTIPIKLKWGSYEKTYEAKFIVEETRGTDKVI